MTAAVSASSDNAASMFSGDHSLACRSAWTPMIVSTSHKKVDKVNWPGFTDNPGHLLAKKQMKDFGGMLSFSLKGNKSEDAFRIASSVKVFSLAESLGGVESLIGHPATMTHASIPKAEREKSGVSDSLLRLSVGIEDIEDLLSDLESALH